jgi:cytochrome c553
MKKLMLPLFALIVTSVTAFTAHAQDVKGDAKAGERKINMCAGCHSLTGYQATFPEIYKVPKISGQSAKYIVSALNAYKTGDRKHPSMRGIADGLTDQDMADLGAFYAASGVDPKATPAGKAPDGNAKVTELIKKGNCISCHGDNFSKPLDPSYPKIAGQHADYLFVALKSYKVDNNPTWGRSNGVMAGIAKQFSNAEHKQMANYLSKLPGELKTVEEKHFR